MTANVVICIPAWGEQYRRLATGLVIPALLRALQRVTVHCQFVVYTDDSTQFQLIPNFDAEYREVPTADTPHEAMTLIHTRTLGEAPRNTLVGLFNADIVPSEEVILLATLALSTDAVAMAAFGLRTIWNGSELPAIPTNSGRELLEWGWRHKHPIVDNCTWGRGYTAFPVTLFFVNGHSNAIAHCSHLHPFFIRKQERDYDFRGTVDDALLHIYQEREVYYPTAQQVGFVELSPHQNPIAPHFMQTRNERLDEAFVIEFGKHYLTTHCRNLKQGFRIIGSGPVYDTPAVVIADEIRGNL